MVDISTGQVDHRVDAMTGRRKAPCRWIEPQDFCDIRHRADLTRKQAADVLDVTVRTIQNWETGGARIPWLAYRMLRILTGCALPGKVWEGWTVYGDRLYAPNGRWFDANLLEQIEQVYAMARLWRQDYVTRHNRPVAVVLPFSGRLQSSGMVVRECAHHNARSARIGGRA
jgi:DNA-binding transcriptional regulator YiaG